MLIRQPPMKTVIEHRTCRFHKEHPGKIYPGCTCSGSYSTVVKPIEEWTEEERRFMADPYAGFGN